jgi:hypothetical protein
MVIQRLGLFLFAISTSFCTDHGLQTGVGDKVVSEADRSDVLKGANSKNSKDGMAINNLVPVGLSLNQDDEQISLPDTTLSPVPLVTTTGQGVCDPRTPLCGPSLIVHLPIDPLFQEGSGGPTDPLEVHGLLEFFQTSDCLKNYVRKTRDLRSSYRSGCIEVEQGIASIKDGGAVSLVLGDYYVRVRGYDGAPYTHFLLAHKEGSGPRDLFIEQLDNYDADEISAAAP